MWVFTKTPVSQLAHQHSPPSGFITNGENPGIPQQPKAKAFQFKIFNLRQRGKNSLILCSKHQAKFIGKPGNVDVFVV